MPYVEGTGQWHGAKTVDGTPFTVCRVNLNNAIIWELFLAGRCGSALSSILGIARGALRVKGKTLVFAVNAGMYKPDFFARWASLWSGARGLCPCRSSRGVRQFLATAMACFGGRHFGTHVIATGGL